MAEFLGSCLWEERSESDEEPLRVRRDGPFRRHGEPDPYLLEVLASFLDYQRHERHVEGTAQVAVDLHSGSFPGAGEKDGRASRATAST